MVSELSLPGFPVGQKVYFGFGASSWYTTLAPVAAWAVQKVSWVALTFPTPRCL